MRSAIRNMEQKETRLDYSKNEKLRISTKAAYALGHIYNDLSAAMWFSYTLIYLQRIVLLEPLTAGAILLLGQVVDAVMTPIFGFLVDRYCDKKIWHIIGSTMVTLSFPMIFGGFTKSSNDLIMYLYVISIVVFQTGWAAVQISHLSMIPHLTNSLFGRSELTAIRYSAQVGAAVVVFTVTWIALRTDTESMVVLGQEDNYKFRNIVIVLTSIGLTTTTFFHIFLKSELLKKPSTRKETDEESVWLLNVSFNNRVSCVVTSTLLKIAMLYLASRLFITLTAVYLPLYVEESAVGGKETLATVPLVSYLSSFIASVLLKYINRFGGTKICYLLGALIGILSGLITKFVGGTSLVIYAVASLIGTGSSITIITALSLTAEIIGPRTEKSAFVYSSVTFLDKVVTGLTVVVIERWRCHENELCPTYNRNALSIVCVASMTLGLLALSSLSRCTT